jgi:hypothetical protein
MELIKGVLIIVASIMEILFVIMYLVSDDKEIATHNLLLAILMSLVVINAKL